MGLVPLQVEEKPVLGLSRSTQRDHVSIQWAGSLPKTESQASPGAKSAGTLILDSRTLRSKCLLFRPLPYGVLTSQSELRQGISTPEGWWELKVPHAWQETRAGLTSWTKATGSWDHTQDCGLLKWHVYGLVPSDCHPSTSWRRKRPSLFYLLTEIHSFLRLVSSS